MPRFGLARSSLVLSSLVCSALACSDGAAVDGDAGGGSSAGGSASTAGVSGGGTSSAGRPAGGAGSAQGGSGGSGLSGAAGGAQGGSGGSAQGGATTAGAGGASAAGGGGGRGGMGGVASGGSAGTSGGPACEDELTACGNACFDLDTDEQHCGSCTKKCDSGQTCNDGECTGGGGVTTCSSITDYGVVSATIVVKNGETHDGQCKRYRAGSSLGDGSQSEDQKPIFVLESGARIRNVVLGSPAADGIHTKGDVTLENIIWEDIGEDALTIKESGTVVLNGGSATNGDDKVFQINAASTFRVSNFKASNAGKFIRQNGDTTFKVAVFIDRCDISNMDEAVFRTDSPSSTVSMTNTRYHAIGDALFVGVAAGNITQSGNTQY